MTDKRITDHIARFIKGKLFDRMEVKIEHGDRIMPESKVWISLFYDGRPRSTKFEYFSPFTDN